MTHTAEPVPDDRIDPDPVVGASGALFGRFLSAVRTVALTTYACTMVWLLLAVVLLSTLGGFESVLIRSGSMSPLVRPGDVAMIRPVGDLGETTLAAGSVITFRSAARDGELLTHRIASVTPDATYVTKGDANAGPDSDVVHPDEIVGVGRVLVPYVGLPVVWYASGEWPKLLAWLGLTLLAVRLLFPNPSRRRRDPPDGAEHPPTAQGCDPPVVRDERVPAASGAGLRHAAVGAAVAALLGALVFPIAVSNAALSSVTQSVGNVVTAAPWTQVVALDAGATHGCFVRNRGEAYCWGRNDKGQLGDGTTTDRGTPVQVLDPSGAGALGPVVEIGSGDSFNCAVGQSGDAWCWGDNGDGQLGDNTTTGRALPVQVKGPSGAGTLSDVTAIAGGASFTCARTSSGAVWCWGRNDKGQLGDGTTTSRLSPVQVKGPGGVGTLAGVVAIAAGAKHACAVTSSGGVWCWGQNGNGQLGDGTTTDRSVPVQVNGAGGVGMLAGANAVASSESSSCAVTGTGAVWCWGRNDRGQLGDGTTTDRSVPVQVKGPGGIGNLTDAVRVGAGQKHHCAVTSGDAVWCWGQNDNGQLGDNSTTQRPTPVQVVGEGGAGVFGSAVLVAGGDLFTCAARSDHTAWCWGRNDRGQLGDNTTTDRRTPVQVKGGGGTGVFDAVAVTAGGAHTCAVRLDATVSCWGRNDKGQLGDTTTSSTAVPVRVTGGGGVGLLTSVTSIASGLKHSCAVTVGGAAWCWGLNDQGQLGDGTTTDRSSPVQVRGPGGVGTLGGLVAVVGGESGTCALTSGGAVWCWGRNDKGQLGDGTTTDRLTPVQVVGPGGAGTLAGITAIAAGAKHRCAVAGTGAMYCWGLNDKGQLGDNSTTDRATPVQVSGVGGAGTLSGVASAEGGDASTCAVAGAGDLFCWGSNDKGQLGDNSTTQRTSPVHVKGAGGVGTLSGVAQVDVGAKHACAVTSNGTMWCWGDNPKGQLGDGTTTGRSTPVAVVGGTATAPGTESAATGDEHTCAVRVDESVWCWGLNGEGQLGDGTTTDASSPRQVL